jgi:hypothetical protein
MEIRIKRVYELPTADDGQRVLIDRLWPRGLSKEKAQIDVWEKEIAPSNELRKWFGHEPEKFEEFERRYCKELENNPSVQPFIEMLKQHELITLLYSAHDAEHNNAVVLAGFITQRLT